MRLRFFQSASGNSAVEFAIIAPVFLLLIFGIVAFSIVFSTYHGVQQLAAEAARAAVAGLDDAERDALARSYINQNIASYPFIGASQLAIDARTQGSTFRVTLTYDNSQSVIYNLPSFLPLPAPMIVRSAAIQRGGY